MCKLITLVLILELAVFAATAPDVSTIIQRSQQATLNDWEAAPRYDYFETDKQPNGGTRTYRELMVEGSPYELLVAVNGKPLSASQQAQQRNKLQAAMAQRRSESPQQRAQRISRYQKERNRNHVLMSELVKAFDFQLEGEQKLDGHAVYVLRATPRRGYQPPNMQARVLTGMQGTLWIDEGTFQWVKVEARVTHPVSIEGFLAQVEPGTQFELEKMPVEEGIWLPKHFSMRAKAKILDLFSRHSGEDETYYGYQKAGPNVLAEASAH